MGSKFRSLLLRISHQISDSNLEDMKYLCTDSIPEGILERIVSPLMLFKQLEKQGNLGIDNLAILHDLLTNIGLIKLANDVQTFNSIRELECFCLTKDREVHGNRRNLRSAVSDGENMHRSTRATITSSLKEFPFGECGCDKQVLPEKSNACCSLHSSLCHPSDLQRIPGEIYLKIVVELATKGAWIAGTVFILKRYINNPTDLARLFASVVLPSGILVKFLCRGSIVCVLEATELQGVQTLWADFKNGALQHAIEDVFITEDLKALANGEEITLKVELDEEMYREVCLELILAAQKAEQIWREIEQRPRSKSDPVTVPFAEKPCNSMGPVRNTFQQDSFCLMANVERKRRLRAERKLQDYKSTIQPQFPELSSYVGDKKNKATGLSYDESDDSSESSSTCDEEDVLEWEDEMEVSNLFWSSVKGSIKEKSWSDFEDAVQRKLSDEVNAGGTPLMSFLTYVLKVNYETRAEERVSLRNFIKLSRWFGPFIAGPEGCLSKMMDLMKNSVSVGADGKITSWFAGYTTDSQAREKLTNEKPGTFLVRFRPSSVTQGFILSRKSRDHGTILDFPIEVIKETGFVEFGDKEFPTLPRLVEELQNTWMEDLYPFHSAEVIGSQLP